MGCLQNTFFLVFILFKKIFYLFIFREKGREGNINVWLPPMHSPLGTWPATQALGIELATPWFAGLHSIH